MPPFVTLSPSPQKRQKLLNGSSFQAVFASDSDESDFTGLNNTISLTPDAVSNREISCSWQLQQEIITNTSYNNGPTPPTSKIPSSQPRSSSQKGLLVSHETGPEHAPSLNTVEIEPWGQVLSDICATSFPQRNIRWRNDKVRLSNSRHARNSIPLQAMGISQLPPCTSCAAGAGPFEVCVAFRGICDDRVVSKGTCANCLWTGHATICSFNPAHNGKTTKARKSEGSLKRTRSQLKVEEQDECEQAGGAQLNADLSRAEMGIEIAAGDVTREKTIIETKELDDSGQVNPEQYDTEQGLSLDQSNPVENEEGQAHAEPDAVMMADIEERDGEQANSDSKLAEAITEQVFPYQDWANSSDSLLTPSTTRGKALDGSGSAPGENNPLSSPQQQTPLQEDDIGSQQQNTGTETRTRRLADSILRFSAPSLLGRYRSRRERERERERERDEFDSSARASPSINNNNNNNNGHGHETPGGPSIDNDNNSINNGHGHGTPGNCRENEYVFFPTAIHPQDERAIENALIESRRVTRKLEKRLASLKSVRWDDV